MIMSIKMKVWIVVGAIMMIFGACDKIKNRGEIVYDIRVQKNPGLPSRLFSTLPYCLPLLEGFQNCARTLAPYPLCIMELYRRTLSTAVQVYTQEPLVSFIAFIMLYYLFIKAGHIMAVGNFARFNVIHAMLLFLTNTLVNMVFKWIPGPIREENNYFGVVLCNGLLWFTLITVGYSIIQALRGKYAEIPIVSEAARMHIFGMEDDYM